jgi:hypothetical protein
MQGFSIARIATRHSPPAFILVGYTQSIMASIVGVKDLSFILLNYIPTIW